MIQDQIPSTKKEVIPLNLAGRVVIITGASDGMGKCAVKHLFDMGARIILACRSQEKTMKVMEEIRMSSGNKDAMMEYIPLDLNDLDSVREFVKTFLAKNIPLHALICNAGIWASEKKNTKQGFEATYQVNHLSHFLSK